MQPLRVLESHLRRLASPDTYLFSLADLEALVPEVSHQAFKMVVTRAVKQGILKRACQGIYLFDDAGHQRGLELYHVAAKLRAGYFNYLSQESVLSDAGIISQIPLQRITVMSSGRSGLVNCGPWGVIEFTHTKRNLEALSSRLTYDAKIRLLRASPDLALKDLKAARRNLNLIDEEALRGNAL